MILNAIKFAYMLIIKYALKFMNWNVAEITTVNKSQVNRETIILYWGYFYHRLDFKSKCY